MNGHVLAIDLGTGGPKVAVIDAGGSTLAWLSAPVSTTFAVGGGAEQDPKEMWSAVVDVTRQVLAALRGGPTLDAVAVTSQYMSTIPVAADGTPTGPCILWMDTRGAAHSRRLLTEETFPLFIARHGLIPLPGGNDNVAHVSVLAEHHPASYAAATAFVEPMDYINARLTGRVRATQSTSFGLLVCDNRTWGATEYDADLVAATGLDPHKLATLGPMNGVVGEVTSAAAGELGIAAGTPVVTGTIDSITSAVGAGAMTAADGSIIIGTTSVMVSHIDEMRGDLMSGLLAVPSPLPAQYFVMAENGVGGRALEWAMQLFGYAIDHTAALADGAQIAAGAEGVRFAPWLLGSIAPQPNADVRGAYTGLSLHHDRRHAMRATLEGVALNLAWLRPAVERFVGGPFPFLRFGGGGALSELWAQIIAEAIDRPVHRLAEPRVTNARGAAFLALAELGVIRLDDVPSLLRIAEVHDPDRVNRRVMDDALAGLRASHPVLAALGEH